MGARVASTSPATAVRGHVITYQADPFHVDDALLDIEDGLIVCIDGRISAFGPYEQTKGSVPDGVEVTHYPEALICPGFIDTHVHYVQTGIIGAFGSQLIDWLNTYTFVEEQRFADKAHADAVAKVFFDQLLANGTTTAVTFCCDVPPVGGRVLRGVRAARHQDDRRQGPDGPQRARRPARHREDRVRRLQGAHRQVARQGPQPVRDHAAVRADVHPGKTRRPAPCSAESPGTLSCTPTSRRTSARSSG